MKMIAPVAETEEELPFKRWSADEVRQLREESPLVSPWRVVAGQVVVGLLVALAAWGLTGKQNVGWSAGYGALAVALPAAVIARGLTKRVHSPGAGAAGFMFWEMVKIALTVAMLTAAPGLVTALSWPALLVGLVLTMKVYWVALAYSPRNTPPRNRKLRVE